MSSTFTGNIPIASSTNASPIAIATGSAHGLLTGATVEIKGHATNTAANGVWVIVVTSGTAFTLTGSTGNGVGGATGSVLVYPSSITIPSDGDLRNALSVNAALQALANRTEWLFNQCAVKVQTFTAVASTVSTTTGNGVSPIQVTATSPAPGGGHGLVTGDTVTISSVVGNTAANGTWTVTKVDATNFTLNGSTGNGAYVSGGNVNPVSIVPSWAFFAVLDGYGSGGGGAGGGSGDTGGADHYSLGGAGGGGAIASTLVVPVVPGAVIPVVIGVGGTGAVTHAAAGGDGNDSLFGSLATFRGASGGNKGTDAGTGQSLNYILGGTPVSPRATGFLGQFSGGSSLGNTTQEFNRGPAEGGVGVSAAAILTAASSIGMANPRGFTGGAAGSQGTDFSGTVRGGGMGGGGGAGPGGVGGVGGNGANQSGSGVTGVAGGAGSSPLTANTGAGGGGGGGGGCGSGGGGVGATGGNGGDGKIKVIYFGGVST